MPFVTAGVTDHDFLSGVSTADHHTATVAGDLNLADMAERDHDSLQNVFTVQHHAVATQADMESEDTANDFVRADRVRHSPGVAKAHCNIAVAGTLNSPSYNVASVTDTGTGDRTIVWDDDFSTDVYTVVGSFTDEFLSGGNSQLYFDVFAVGSVRLVTHSVAATVFDGSTSQVAFGDQ